MAFRQLFTSWATRSARSGSSAGLTRIPSSNGNLMIDQDLSPRLCNDNPQPSNLWAVVDNLSALQPVPARQGLGRPGRLARPVARPEPGLRAPVLARRGGGRR